MKKLFQILMTFILLFNGLLISQNQNVSINTTGLPADNSAILDVSATDKGLLIPRMNSGQREAIVAPATGLLVYDTGYDQFWYFNGTEWAAIGGGGEEITAFSWTDLSDILTITFGTTDWSVTIDNEADDLTDNILNDLSNVNANPTTGQVLKWDGSQWIADTDQSGGTGTQITAFSWTDATDLLRISEGVTNWDVTIDNEADDLTNDVINDLSDVNATTPSNGDFLQWNGTAWVAAGAGASCVTLEEAYNCGGNGVGRSITANYGAVAITISTADATNYKGLQTISSATNSFAISSEHSSTGVAIGAGSTNASNVYSTIQATTNASSDLVSAILGNTTGAAYGVTGQVEASGTSFTGVYGNNLRTTGGTGVYGTGYNGVVGECSKVDGYGVSGWNSATSDPGIGTFGQGITGIAGQSLNISLSYGVYSYDDCGIYNNLDVGGNLWVGGSKSFRIDNPLYPDEKFLVHFCIESPEILNLYRGTAIIDENGEAIVSLPEYFEEININYTYNLTPIGESAPNLYIKQKIKNGNFIIAGGKPNQEIDWVVYAERNDKYLQDNPEIREVEPLKTGRYEGKYVHPSVWNKSGENNILYKKNPIIKGDNNKQHNQQKQNILQ